MSDVPSSCPECGRELAPAGYCPYCSELRSPVYKRQFRLLKGIVRLVRAIECVALLATHALVGAGIMGLARAGRKGPFFFIEEAFYISTMAYPLTFFICTVAAKLLVDRKHLVAALLVQAAPVVVPAVLWILVLKTWTL